MADSIRGILDFIHFVISQSIGFVASVIEKLSAIPQFIGIGNAAGIPLIAVAIIILAFLAYFVGSYILGTGKMFIVLLAVSIAVVVAVLLLI